MRRPSPLRQIEKLRTFRRERRRDVGIAGEVESIERSITRHSRRAGGFEELFERLVPRDLAGRVRVDRYTTKGVLVVRAGSAADRFLMTQWLACGGLEALKREGPATLKLVQVKA